MCRVRSGRQIYVKIMSEFQSQEMLKKNVEMSPIGPKTGPKSDQKAVGGTTCKTIGKTDRPGAGAPPVRRPPPHADVMADPAPPHTPLGGEPKREPCACASGKKRDSNKTKYAFSVAKINVGCGQKAKIKHVAK